MSYKPVAMAPPKRKLPQSHRQKETPKMDKPVKYEKSSRRTRS